MGGTTLGRALPSHGVQVGRKPRAQAGAVSKLRLSSRSWAVREAPFSPRNSCFTAVWALLRESLSSPSQDWERFLVPCPVGWHRARFMLHGLSKPCRGVDGAFQGPEVQFLAQLFLLVVCKVHFPPAPAFVRVLRARQSLNSGKTSCLA